MHGFLGGGDEGGVPIGDALELVGLVGRGPEMDVEDLEGDFLAHLNRHPVFLRGVTGDGETADDRGTLPLAALPEMMPTQGLGHLRRVVGPASVGFLEARHIRLGFADHLDRPAERLAPGRPAPPQVEGHDPEGFSGGPRQNGRTRKAVNRAKETGFLPEVFIRKVSISDGG